MNAERDDPTANDDPSRRAGASDLDADGDADALPATASPVGLIGLLGFVSLAGAAAVRAFRRLL
jgi:hypothetical protein